MLYVSSVEGDKVGVTDTDDGVTQYAKKDSLLKAAKKYNLQIQGVAGDEVTIIVNGKEEKAVLGVPAGVKLQGTSKPSQKQVKARATGKKTQVIIDGKVEEAIVGPIKFD